MEKAKKSVLFICADQWRFDCFSFLNHQYALTPNLDNLAKKSVIFKSHFAGIIPCGPSRTTMLTGLYPFIHRSVYNGAPLDKRFTNITRLNPKILVYQLQYLWMLFYPQHPTYDGYVNHLQV